MFALLTAMPASYPVLLGSTEIIDLFTEPGSAFMLLLSMSAQWGWIMKSKRIQCGYQSINTLYRT